MQRALEMLRIDPLPLPNTYPHPKALRSCGQNRHSYEPEFWEFEYNIYRYLSRVSKDELAKRYRDLVRNMNSLIKSDRHVIPIQNVLSSWYWYRKEHQTRLEFSLRRMSLPLESPVGLLENSAAHDTSQRSFPKCGRILYRYGRRTYMEEMVREGLVRIAPASYYREFELDPARMDEELAKSSFMPGDYTRMVHKGKPSPFIGDVRRAVFAPNYYALCMSLDCDPFLLGAFGADAIVVIREPEVFAQRLDDAAKNTLEGWYFHHNPVCYFDPYETLNHRDIDARMFKDFSFAYQREYRFLWMHQNGRESNGFKYLNLGPLHDIAEIHIACE
jgi:hypothetical protein